MNTLFEIILAEPEENHIAAAEAALDEVQRIETVLSRFDPTSEATRVNIEAAQQPVLISFELLEVLKLCRDFRIKTDGHFDITATSARGKDFDFSVVVLDETKRTLCFGHPEAKLDFGAFGKGFALDRAADILKENGVLNALLHGGTSSVLALGKNGDDVPWQIGVRDPQMEAPHISNDDQQDRTFSPSPQPSPAGRGRSSSDRSKNSSASEFSKVSDNYPLSQRERSTASCAAWPCSDFGVRERFEKNQNAPKNEMCSELALLKLTNQGFSTSATLRNGQSVSDILNPKQGIELNAQASCSVIANTATEAEVFSTAFLSMGKSGAESWLAKNTNSSLRVLWIEVENKSPEWLS